MLFRQLFDLESRTYTYLIADSNTHEALLVDPVLEQVERERRLLQELGLTLQYCLETHIHSDRITGTGKLKELTHCLSVVPEGTATPHSDRALHDRERLKVGSVWIQAIATPGHTDSHMAYWIADLSESSLQAHRILTGDALLIRGCGRTDFQGGDAGVLYDRVTEWLFDLPDETLVYPAHDYRGQTVSTIGEEKRWNPRFASRSRDEFIDFMVHFTLPMPENIMEAMPAN